MKQFLKDDLISLRALEPDDVDKLYLWENDEEIWTVSHTLAPFSKHTLTRYIQNADKDIFESGQLRMMIDTRGGETIGAIDLFDFEPFHSRAGVGILIYKLEDRSRGYATAALNLMIRYCSEKLGLHQIYANILTDNEISIRLFEKAGFVLTGTKKDWIKESGHWQAEHLYQLVLS